jgi:steroid delta-isomerase-like uncharacterized protein
LTEAAWRASVAGTRREEIEMAETSATRVGEELDREWLDAFITRWQAAWNSHRPESLLELMTEDVVYDDSGWPETMRGHAEVRRFVEHAWRAFPDLAFEMTDGPYIVPGAPKAAFYWRGTGTFTGPLEPPGLAPTGDRFEFEGVDTHDYRDGKVARLRIVFDMMDVARQLGMLPQPGSRAERAGAVAQRLGVRVRSRLGR